MTFTVVATDGGEPSLNSTAQVCINVLETNANEPAFVPDFLSVDVRSDMAVGLEVATVSALHLDSGNCHFVQDTFLML